MAGVGIGHGEQDEGDVGQTDVVVPLVIGVTVCERVDQYAADIGDGGLGILN